MVIVGIDPGKEGGLAALDTEFGIGEGLAMPLMGKEIDGRALMAWLAEMAPDLVMVEQVHSMPKQGVKSTFSFGKGYGMLLGVLEGKGYAYRIATPQAWKAKVLAGTPKDKDAAISFVHRAYPYIDLLPGRKRTPHDGIADAVCLADYGRQLLVKDAA